MFGTQADIRSAMKTFNVGELDREPPLEAETDAEPLGQRERELPMRHLGANVLADPTGLLQRPLLVAGLR
jgi:hypothetical protein